MTDETRDNLTDKGTWLRLLYIILFALAFKVAALLMGIVTVVQFFSVLFTKKPNARLQTFGGDVGNYLRDVARFLTYHTDHMPYPVSDWGQPTDEPKPTKARAKASTPSKSTAKKKASPKKPAAKKDDETPSE